MRLTGLLSRRRKRPEDDSQPSPDREANGASRPVPAPEGVNGAACVPVGLGPDDTALLRAIQAGDPAAKAKLKQRVLDCTPAPAPAAEQRERIRRVLEKHGLPA